MVSDEEEGGEPRWVGCDGCSKWRKVTAGFQFDHSKSFFCSMIESLTCDTPEEQWDEEEEFEIFDGGAPPTVDRCSIIGRIDVLVADKRDWCELSCANARLHVEEVGGNEHLSNQMPGSLFDNFVNACVRSVCGRECRVRRGRERG